jgi:uncharacterized membrane protein YcaP (DUF421 family)
MKSDEIKINDWGRMLVGETPAVFFLEVIVRALVVYAILMIAFRLMGSRMASQLNRIEQASLVTLAAAIGVPIQSPERGILPAVIIAIVVVVSGRLIAGKSSRNERFEKISQGKINTLIEDGTLMVNMIRKTTLTRERIFAQLRSNKIVHLGQIKRLYFESNGSFTIVKQEASLPGLVILPEHDISFLERLPKTEEIVCGHCGHGRNKNNTCSNCGEDKWEHAVSLKQKE